MKPAGAGLGDDEEGLVGADGEPVGELQAVQHHLGSVVARRQAQQPTRSDVLDDVADPVLQGVAATGDGEVDGAVGEGHDVAAEPQRLPRHRVGEDADRAVAGADAQQAAFGVAHQQVAVREEFEPQRPAAGLGDHLSTGRDRVRRTVQTQDAAVRHVGQHTAARVGGHVLGAVAHRDVVAWDKCRGMVHDAHALRPQGEIPLYRVAYQPFSNMRATSAIRTSSR